MEAIGKLIARVMREASCEENRRAILEFLNFLEDVTLQGYSEHYQKQFRENFVAA